MVNLLIVGVMANLQNLEQSTYGVLQDYFKLLSRRGWVKQASVNRILVLLFTVQFWWKYSVLMTDEEVRLIQRVFNCLGVDCLIPSMHSHLHDKVVINKRYFGNEWVALISERDEDFLMSEKAQETFLIPEQDLH